MGPVREEPEKSHVRVDAHVHLHIDALLKIQHNTLDARFKVVPSSQVLALNSGVPRRTHQGRQVAYVAPMSSLLGIEGIVVGGCCARATVDAITLNLAMVMKDDVVALWWGVGDDRGVRDAGAARGG